MFHSVLLRAARRPQLRLDALQAVLAQKPITNPPWARKSFKALKPPQQALFAPLFSNNDFVFENQQLTLLGDSLIDAYLSEVFLDYFLNTGIVTTTNTAKLLNSVFHNHFSMRKLAEDLGMMDLCAPTDPTSSASTLNGLDFLEEQTSGPSGSDVAGTSFENAPLTCGQSELGWKFSHLIGALHQCYGRDGVHALLEVLFDLKGTSNIIGKGTQWLFDLVERYSPMHVAEALLAAQGISAEFVAATEFIRATPKDASSTSRRDNHEGSKPTVVGSMQYQRHTDGAGAIDETQGELGAALSTSGRRDGASVATTLEGFETLRPHDLSVLHSSLAGPEFVNALSLWRERALEREVGSSAELEVAVPSGWLSPQEHSKAKRGPAYSEFVDFSTASFLADTAGVQHPLPGKRVSRVPFVRPVLDKQYFDKLSDFRDGIPMDTGGLSVPSFLKQINECHERRFSIALVVDGSRVLGRATASNYCAARVAVCQGYLMGAVRDLSVMADSSRPQESSDSSATF
jgi:hypothetical protein